MKIRNFAMALLIAATLSGPAAFAQVGGSVINATFTTNVVNGAPTDFPSSSPRRHRPCITTANCSTSLARP
ncbi:MAG: hypothetical protein IPJ48_18030 [Propionivibrio sp.]|uniref:Uncharacterized protein n=1 Tax=Candidatus Propionivibrio dominans TaxID=2954373 RepID=A0A9D7FA12_9RHOO|nr:hypothetical protein [Candidatus Propionivibrio dominans]